MESRVRRSTSWPVLVLTVAILGFRWAFAFFWRADEQVKCLKEELEGSGGVRT
jgi:hypothetical protein